MRCYKLPHLLLALLLAPLIRADEQRPKPKAANTPEQAVKFLLEAAKAGDVDGFHAQLGANTHAAMQMARAAENYFAALDDKFGKNPKSRPRPSVTEGFFKMNRYEIRERVVKDGKRVDLTVWEIGKNKDGDEFIHEETWVCVKQPNGWKIVFPPKGVITQAIRKKADGKEVRIGVLKTREFDAGKSAQEAKMWLEAAQVLQSLVKEIRGGSYSSRDEAEAALRKAKQRLLKKEK
jgi:hypothetical protein